MSPGPSREIANVTIEVAAGNIANQPGIDVIVNAANAQLSSGGGVAGAIHRAAGPGLADECPQYAPIKPGQCVMTGGHRLPNAHVIHCLGPVYGIDEPAADLLSHCYRGALVLADRHQLESIAFPAISTGAFGYPPREAAEVAVESVWSMAYDLEHVTLVRFVLFDEPAVSIYTDVLAAR
jgi:O-acetyl-ADP-ribose deacetylase (regulator of RNase III)